MFLEIPVSLPRYLCSRRCHQGAAAGAARVPGGAEGRLQHPCEMRHTKSCVSRSEGTRCPHGVRVPGSCWQPLGCDWEPCSLCAGAGNPPLVLPL